MVGFDTSTLPYLDFRDAQGFFTCIEGLKKLFWENKEQLAQVFLRGSEYRAAFENMDPFIQSYTAEICPYCGSVCCANRHGMPEYADIVGMLAMGLEIPEYDLGVEQGAMCQFMGEEGCVLPRARRPYRCTWYFCDPLLLKIDMAPMQEYRFFINGVQELSRARGEMLRTFVEACRAAGLKLPT